MKWFQWNRSSPQRLLQPHQKLVTTLLVRVNGGMSNGRSKGLIIGLVVGGAFALVVVAAVFVFVLICYKKFKPKTPYIVNGPPNRIRQTATREENLLEGTVHMKFNRMEMIIPSEDSKTTEPPKQNSKSEDNGSLVGTEENDDGVPKKERTSSWEESGQQSNEHPVYSSSVTKKEGNQVYMQNIAGKSEDEENSAEQVGVAIAPLPYSGPTKGTITGKSEKMNRRGCQPGSAITRSDNLPNLQAPRPPENHDSSEDHDSVVKKDDKAAVSTKTLPGIKQVSNTLAQNTTMEDGPVIFAAITGN